MTNTSRNGKNDEIMSQAEDTERGQWDGKFDFLMSMIAYAVGLGNVWRFPYLCYKNGGGTFLVAYSFFFVLAAVPIFVMEVSIGQYLQKGAMEMWRMCPLFKGVGIGNVVIAFMCIAYFCVIVSWAIFYMISSFNSTFPWETCDNWWNTVNCLSGNENATVVAALRAKLKLMNQESETSVEQFWEKRVLYQTDSIDEFGGIQWELLTIMFFAWLIIYFALWKGITSARKFVYFCALFPYFLIFVLLLRGLTLEGASTGISFYLTPNITKLADTTVWKDAGTQVFYSYGVGFGALIALGSHNKRDHNCFRDAVTMCFVNGSTSIVAGFAIFSILGHMSVIANKDIAEIVKPGVGLAFLAYPEVATRLPLKQLWAFLFFLMITILGLDSQVCMMEGLFTALEDAFPILRRHKKIALGLCCFGFFLLGIPMVTYSGVHWLNLFDQYGASGYALLFVVFFEVVGLSWGFGAEKIRGAIKTMTGIQLSTVWVLLWKYASPMTSFLLFVFCIVYFKPLYYAGTNEPYPVWATAFGFFLSSCSMLSIPLYALYYLIFENRHLSFKERLIKGFRPTSINENNGTQRAEEMTFLPQHQ